MVSCVAQKCNCCDRWNTFNLISGDINSLSLGCLCSWYLRAAAARAPSRFLTVCALDNSALIFNNLGALGTLVLESFVRRRVLVWKIAWCHPHCKLIYGHKRHFSCFYSYYSLTCDFCVFKSCSAFVHWSAWRSLKVFLSCWNPRRGEGWFFRAVHKAYRCFSPVNTPLGILVKKKLSGSHNLNGCICNESEKNPHRGNTRVTITA